MVSAPFKVFKNCKGPNSGRQVGAEQQEPRLRARSCCSTAATCRPTVMPWLPRRRARPGRGRLLRHDGGGQPGQRHLQGSLVRLRLASRSTRCPSPHVAMSGRRRTRATTTRSASSAWAATSPRPAATARSSTTSRWSTTAAASTLDIVYSNAGKLPGEAAGHSPALRAHADRRAQQRRRHGASTDIGLPADHGARQGRRAPVELLLHQPGRAGGPADPAGAVPASTSLTAARARPSASGAAKAGVVVTMHQDGSPAAAVGDVSEDLQRRRARSVDAFRFVDDDESSAAVARYDVGQGCAVRLNRYATSNAGCISKDDKCLIYPGNEDTGDGPKITGKVDVASGTITLTIPVRLLKALGKPEPRRVSARRRWRRRRARGSTTRPSSPSATRRPSPTCRATWSTSTMPCPSTSWSPPASSAPFCA